MSEKFIAYGDDGIEAVTNLLTLIRATQELLKSPDVYRGPKHDYIADWNKQSYISQYFTPNAVWCYPIYHEILSNKMYKVWITLSIYENLHGQEVRRISVCKPTSKLE